MGAILAIAACCLVIPVGMGVVALFGYFKKDKQSYGRDAATIRRGHSQNR